MQTLKALAVLLAVFLPCSVFASQSDNFDDNSKDPSLWGNDVLEGGARLDEVNGRLEYSVSQPGPDHDQAGRPWIQRLPMGQDWVATVAVGNTSSPADRHDSTAGFKIFHPSNPGEVLFVELYAFRDGGRVHRGVLTSLDGPNNVFGEADAQGLGVETALLRISYNSQSKVVTTSYKIGAGDWVDLGVFGLGGSGGSTANRDWSLSPTGNFGLMLGGFSGASVVSPGQIWLDDFSLEVPTINVHGRILTVSATATSELTSHNRLAAHLLDASWNAEETSASLGLVWESAGIGFHPGGPHDRAPMVMFDLGKSHSLSKIRIWNFPEPPVAVKRLAVEVSNDGVEYTQVEIVDNMEIAGETLVPVSIPFARHVRFRILNNHGGTAYPVLEGEPVTGFFAFAGLVEVAFYGAGAESSAPKITREPLPQTIDVGGDAVFSVQATGVPAPSYQWRRNGVDLEEGERHVGVKSSQFTLRMARVEDGGEFDVVVFNVAGSIPSAKVPLVVRPPAVPPAITLHPQSKTVVEGGGVKFSAGASGTPTPSLKWQRSTDGGQTWSDLVSTEWVQGVDSAELTIVAAKQEFSNHRFRLHALNSAGSAFSDPATLTVQPVVAQPVLIAGVLATATSELTSHNRLAAHAVNGVYCDHSFFETAGVGFTPGGPDDRDPAITFDLRSPVALSHFIIWNSHEHDPAIKRMVVEVSMDGVQFTPIGEKTLQPGGGCPPIPQTVDMGGEVARYVRFDFLENWNGVIFPVVGSPTGWPFIAIDEVEFYGSPGLAIHPQPRDLRVFEGSEAVLTVGLSSGADAQYQWWRDGERLADGAGVSGAASATLRLRGVAPADAGRFQAVATLDSISLTSRVATLTVRMAPPMNQRTNFSVLHVFDDSFFKESNKPGKVGSGLIEGSDGFLYGTTRHGGTNLVDVAGPARGVGTLYRIRKDGTEFTILHHFGGDNSSSYSSIWTEPIEASDGLLYGVTYAGGVAGVGYIYKIHRDGSGFAILHHFQDGSVSGDAARSTAPLVEGPDGMLYGVTQYGGVKPSWTDWGQGTAFRIAKDGSNYQVLHSFGATPQSPTQPTGLSLGRDGRLYGTTARGGDLGAGTLFRMNLDGGDLVVLAELGNWSSRPDFLPGNPLHASDGLLYGMSQSSGHIYKLQPSDGEFSLLTPILSSGSGGEPRPALIETRGGYLATPVISHGAHNAGSVVALSKDGSEVATLHSFNPSVEPGGYPSSRLLEASDGALYGVTGMVDKTPENGGHAMIYRLAWNDNPNIWVLSPTRRPGGGWRIPFTTEETGLHTLWHAAKPSGPWVAAQSLFLKAAEGEFTHEEGSENAIFFRISKE